MNDSDILERAKKRFAYSLERSSHNREKAKQDIRFAASSPDDPWQWDETTVQERTRARRPMLVINKMPLHIRQVTNDMRQNRPSIKYRPADDKADVEVAEILNGLVRHIEANSNADVAYDNASQAQVTHGLGYVRVLTDYISPESFDQDIFIVPIKDTFKVFDDPEIEDPAGSDRRFFGLEDYIHEDEFKAQYPKAEPIDWNHLSNDEWYDRANKHVRIAEYYEVEDKDATLLLWANGSTSFEGDPLPQGVFIGERPLKTRKSRRRVVCWYKLSGQEVLDKRDIPCSYIPVARFLGNEWVVDGKSYISGLVRNAKDSQRMYNIAVSAISERVLQAPKSPWVTPAEAIEGYEKNWQSANTGNDAFLPYNHVDAEGNPIPKPERQMPTMVEAGLNQVAMGASDDIKAETGQFDASLGQKSNETSGRAIMARQREGDTATYHYIDNAGQAVRHLGRIILDMIPKIYDTKRVARILGEDGSPANAILDPNQGEALVEQREDSGDIQRIFNPNIGTYDVYTTTGPSFTTRRMEALDAMTSMTQANPQLWQVIGDLMVKSMDWPGADDMAKRLRLTLLPPIQQEIAGEENGNEVPPQVQMAMDQMSKQIQDLGQALENASKHAEELENSQETELKKLLIQAYDSETKRLQALNTGLTPEQVQALVMQTMNQALTTPSPSVPIVEEMAEEEATEHPAQAGFFTPEVQQ